MLSSFCQQIQDLWLSRAISGSTWGYPVIGAIHVLSIAFMGGAVFVGGVAGREDATQLRAWKRLTLSIVVMTGILLFASNAVRYEHSRFFAAKILLFLLLVIARRRPYISIVLWIAVIFAARGTAFF